MPVDFEVLIPEDDSVRLLSHLLEGLNYNKLLKAYSHKGRKPGVHPKTLFKIIAYAYMNNILKSLHLRVNRSIQAEGAFGVLKSDYRFNRFITRGKNNVETELLLLCFGYYINKLHAKIQNKRLRTALYELRQTA